MHNITEVETTVKFKLTAENGDLITVELNREGAESLVKDLQKALGQQPVNNHYYPYVPYRTWPFYNEPIIGNIFSLPVVKPMITWNSNSKQTGNISCSYAGMGT